MALRESASSTRRLASTQQAGIQVVMWTFVDDDLSRGVSPSARLYCDACERPRPMAGFIAYGRSHVCNSCATEYEVARAEGRIGSPGQFLRDKRFGEADAYALEDRFIR